MHTSLHDIAQAGLDTGLIACRWDLSDGRVIWGEATCDDTWTQTIVAHETVSSLAEGFGVAKHARHKLIESANPDNPIFSIDLPFTDRAGRTWLVREAGRLEFGPDGTPTGALVCYLCLAADHHADATGAHAPAMDGLTGLPNANSIHIALERAISNATESGNAAAFITIGLDQLDIVNRTYGMRSADQVLANIGVRLKSLNRDDLLIGRLHSDQFAVIAEDTTLDDAEALAEELRQLIAGSPIETDHGPVRIFGSVGVVNLPHSAVSARDALSAGSEALREAKRRGRNTIVVWTQKTNDAFDQADWTKMAKEVIGALEEDRFALAFQPIVASSRDLPTHYECLLRMKDSQGELVPAAMFVPVLEKLGLIRDVDGLVLQKAVAELCAFEDLRLAVNLSGLTASDPEWLATAERTLGGRPDIAQRLLIEITETTALYDVDRLGMLVDRLRTLGCHVALDDFGGGYTSFRHIRGLNIDFVKIDGSFVQNITEDRDNQQFVRAIQDLASGFGFITIAERVETHAESRMLSEIGVDYQQGYLFGRPSLERAWLTASGANDADAAVRTPANIGSGTQPAYQLANIA